MLRAQGLFEAGVGGAGIDEEGVTELADITKALDRGCIERGQRHSIKRDVVPQGVADNLIVTSHGSRVARGFSGSFSRFVTRDS